MVWLLLSSNDPAAIPVPEEEGSRAARQEAGVSTGTLHPVRRGIVTPKNLNCQRGADFMGGEIEKVDG
jgi:hypothetical protein